MAKAPRFDAAWNRKCRWKAAWRRWRWVPGLAILAGLAVWARQAGWGDGEWQEMAQQFPVCGTATRGAGCVIDGDTIAIGERRIRLSGYDAPELDGECENERLKAVEAQFALSHWLSAGPFELDGGADRPRDKYGRELAEARRGNVRLSDHMIGLGLATENGWMLADDWASVEWCA